MADPKETIIIPVMKNLKKKLSSLKSKDKSLFLIFACYLVLLILIVFLPMENYLKVLSLLLGSFILLDLLHFMKAEILRYGRDR